MIPRSSMLPPSVCTVSALLFGLVCLSACGGGAPESGGDEVALRTRIAALETRVDEQNKMLEEDRELMARFLHASTDRFDEVMAALGVELPNSGSPGEPATDTSDPNAGPARPEVVTQSEKPTPPGPHEKVSEPPVAAEATPQDTLLGDIDTAEVLVVFLTVSLMGLVIVVVFFPGRIRGAPPKIDYAAIAESTLDEGILEEEAIAGLQDDVCAAPDLADPSVPVAPRPTVLRSAATASADPAPSHSTPSDSNSAAGGGTPDEDLPVRHELSIPVRGQEEIAELAEVLNRFLSTEPYILNEPSPQVALDGGELLLRFFALPTLSAMEHDLLDDAVRRLAPEQGPLGGRPEAAGSKSGSKPGPKPSIAEAPDPPARLGVG